ncbi:MAG: hypothetical protein AMXMBFR33_09660 [Candidatus Xenobia bacterium]|jgi:lysophospholipase L1-like esterase
MPSHSFELYLSLGDSMSIDDYAGPGLGAASLLYSNHDERHPEFRGRDLLHLSPACRMVPRARNGLDSRGLLSTLQDLPEASGPVLVTLTIGGNDLIGRLRPTGGENINTLRQRIELAISQLAAAYHDLTLVMGNIYDPTDGTGQLPSGARWFEPATHLLPEYNVALREIAVGCGAYLADINAAFAGQKDRFYSFDIEPSVLGASAIRRCFWEALP